MFGEWEAQWSEQWLSQIGVRGEVVKTDTGPVQGYNAQPIWSVDAAAFNAAYRPRTDHNLDFTALTRYTPDATQTLSRPVSPASHARPTSTSATCGPPSRWRC